jgi:amino acid transporter
MADEKEKFLGAYFDRDAVLSLSRLSNVLAWVVLAIYVLTTLFSWWQFSLQFSGGLFFEKGMSLANLFNLATPYLIQPLPGIFYFVGLRAISQGLLIFLDVEDNTRRAAKK